MRRIVVLLVLAAVVGIGPASEAVACPSRATAEGCCCGPDSCSCLVRPSTERAAQSCGCGSSVPTPATPLPAGPSLSGPGTELATIDARLPAALAAPAPAHRNYHGLLGGQPSWPLIYLIECALLI